MLNGNTLAVLMLTVMATTSLVALAEPWYELDGSASGGGLSATAGASTFPSVAVGSDGSVAVAWIDETMGRHIYVKLWRFGQWHELNGSASGTGLDGSSSASRPSVSIDALGSVLIAYVDDSASRVYFKRWDGFTWSGLGGSDSGNGLWAIDGGDSVGGTAVTTDATGNPVVAIVHGNYPTYRMRVRFWNGVTWVENNPTTTDHYYSPALCRSQEGDIWAIADYGNEDHRASSIRVWQYTGGAWSDRGTLSYLLTSKRGSIAVDSRGRPVVTWMARDTESPDYYRILVARYDGAAWQGLAGSNTGNGISDAGRPAGLPSVTFAEGDAPVVAFIQSGAYSRWLCIKTFDGSNWVEFGDGSAVEPGLSDSCAPTSFWKTWGDQCDWPYERRVSLAGNRQVFFCAWESAASENILAKMFGAVEYAEGSGQYIYDRLSRLKSVVFENGVDIGYTYDPAGNRLAKEVRSKLTASRGHAAPSSHSIGNTAVNEPILQVALDVSDEEALVLDHISVEASGIGDDARAIAAARLWRDVNADGFVDGEDIQLGADLVFGTNDGTVTFSGLAHTLSAGTTTHLLVAFTFNGLAANLESFHASISNRNGIGATGLISGHSIYALGAPVDGATLIVSTDMTAPAFAGIQSATARDQSAYLEWQPATDASTPITYHIWQGTESFEGTVTGQPAYTTQELSYTVPGLVNGQPYYFVVRAADSAGNMDANTVEGYAVPQAALFVLTATAGPNGSVQPEPSQFVYEDGTDVYVIPSGDVGYHFTAWTGDVPMGQESSEPLVLTMDANKTVEASFERSRGTVVIDVTPETASWTFVDGDGAPHSGVGDATVSGMPTGQIPITWDPLSGFTAPTSPLTKTLGRDATIIFSAFYGPVVVFSAQPQDQTKYAGESVQFEVQANGGLGALEYQWLFDNGAKAVVPVGGNSPVLSISDLTLSNGGTYWCEVTDDMPATYASANAALQVGEHLEITQHPVGCEKRVGESHTFTVETTGGMGSMAYLWKKGEVEIPGETGPTYTLPSLTLDDSGAYTVTVSDEYTDVRESNTAVLEVTTGLPVTALAALIVLLAIVVIVANKRSLIRNSDALMGGNTKR